MPRGDGTGPMGMGSQTGRQAGYCSDSDAPGFANARGRVGSRQGFGQGVFGRGSGRGRCRSAWRQGPMPEGVRNSTMEQQDMQPQSQSLQSTLDAINERLSRLENATLQG